MFCGIDGRSALVVGGSWIEVDGGLHRSAF
jgi:hypothetical protein